MQPRRPEQQGSLEAGTNHLAREFVGRYRLETPIREEGPLAETEIVDAVGSSTILSPHARDTYREVITPALERRQAVLKRCVDVLGAGLGVVLLSPLLAMLALLVKLDSPGPVLFAQARVGLGGRPFRMLKLRTMHDGADDEKAGVAHLNRTDDSRLFKIPADPRVTRLGRIIRRWSLDELPQLYNIFVGDMSLVGPRPFFESDLADYEAHHFRRLAVKPGVTGLWQVSGRSDVVDFEEVVRLDRQYIEHWSMALDLSILARTVPAVVMRRGAY
jgi:lipopolysaccharide/colanic/teichoic acid biosynthesis glycosyltransferase